MKIPFRQFALAAAVAVCAGCATSRVASDPRIVVDPSVSSLVKVLTVDYGETKGANPVVALALQSTSGRTRRIQYRTVWLDKNGAAVSSALSVWKTATLDPDEVADLKAVAPRSDVSGFRVEIRKAP